MKDTKYNIHATNINGLGAINVANEILNSLMPLNNIQKIYYSNGIKSAENNNNYFLLTKELLKAQMQIHNLSFLEPLKSFKTFVTSL